MRVLKALPILVLLAGAWPQANAAADFITIHRGQLDMGDSVPSLVLGFTLPPNFDRLGTIPNSAVLDLTVLGSRFDFNEVYINPPIASCTDNDADPNEENSLGALQEHDDDKLKTEWATNHIAFSSFLMNAGSNQLLFCVRSREGNVGDGGLDDVSIKSVVLHYHTTR